MGTPSGFVDPSKTVYRPALSSFTVCVSTHSADSSCWPLCKVNVMPAVDDCEFNCPEKRIQRGTDTCADDAAVCANTAPDTSKRTARAKESRFTSSSETYWPVPVRD